VTSAGGPTPQPILQPVQPTVDEHESEHPRPRVRPALEENADPDSEDDRHGEEPPGPDQRPILLAAPGHGPVDREDDVVDARSGGQRTSSVESARS